MSYIPRAIEEEIRKCFKTSKSLAITGARQVGKTTVTRYLYPDTRRINMRDSFLYSAAKDDPLGFLKGYGTPLFIDEVQNAPFLLGEVKVVLDEANAKGNYIFSGSQKWHLMKGLSESLAGMVSVLELPTLSMREITGVCFNKPFSLDNGYLNERVTHLKNYGDVWEHIHRGFYPELFDDNPRDWERFYSDYVRTYLEKDVYDILKVRDVNLFYRFLVSVAARTGSVLNCFNIGQDIGVNGETVRSWIGVLERTGIVYLLQPYFNSHLTRAIKSPKIYFRDTGLASYLTNWKTMEQLKAGAMNGAMFETFVVNEILKSYSNAGRDYSHCIYYYRGKGRTDTTRKNTDSDGEIDLIIDENNVLYPIEIKKTGNVRASMASCFKTLDKDISKKRGTGAIICTCSDKVCLGEDLLALPIEYI